MNNQTKPKRFCTECGAELTGEHKFCTECGAVIKEKEVEKNPEVTNTPAPPVLTLDPPPPRNQPLPPPPTFQQPKQQNTYNDPPPSYNQPQTQSPMRGSEYEPISTLGYIGIYILLALPLIGFILTIVWAVGGCRKINKRNMARANLIIMAAGIVLSIISLIVLYAIGFNFLNELINFSYSWS
ncbi:MAG: zinc ribbon domain-containing protein [Oscillospiraceae bacterium]|nr:zinc ribbon domain-containing protein [Oscillospiraceae bacterium]